MVSSPHTVRVVHLAASEFLGGPERQMLGLAESLAPDVASLFVSFARGGGCRAFLDEAQRRGFPVAGLKHDKPRLMALWRELTDVLRTWRADVVCCHGYKANLFGLLAGRRLQMPLVAVSRGWTGETFPVRLYEALDRLLLRRMDRVVCVSRSQAERVRRAGVPESKLTVIPNAIRAERFDQPDGQYRLRLQQLFPSPPAKIVGAAGRLSCEKGFDVLIDAAADAARADPSVGFVLFGEGRLRDALMQRIRERQLDKVFVMPGFCPDLDAFLPHFDLLVIPSFTEGLSNVALEAFAAGVPVVATAVGGNPEVVEEGVSGFLVPPGDAPSLARGMSRLLANDPLRQEMGRQGRQKVLKDFSFALQAERYRQLFARATGMG